MEEVIWDFDLGEDYYTSIMGALKEKPNARIEIMSTLEKAGFKEHPLKGESRQKDGFLLRGDYELVKELKAKWGLYKSEKVSTVENDVERKGYSIPLAYLPSVLTSIGIRNLYDAQKRGVQSARLKALIEREAKEKIAVAQLL